MTLGASAYFVLKYLHVLGAIVLFGTGVGIAFFMLAAHRSGDAAHVARTASTVVLADWLFTATAIVVQPITGYFLLRQTGGALSESWVVASLALYIVAGAAWLPVVWLQMRMRDLAAACASSGELLSAAYHRLFRAWFVLGFPGFASVAGILWLMIAKPRLWG